MGVASRGSGWGEWEWRGGGGIIITVWVGGGIGGWYINGLLPPSWWGRMWTDVMSLHFAYPGWEGKQVMKVKDAYPGWEGNLCQLDKLPNDLAGLGNGPISDMVPTRQVQHTY